MARQQFYAKDLESTAEESYFIGVTQQESKRGMDDRWEGEAETGRRYESAARWRKRVRK